jgi:hypothetical protein
MMIAITLGLAVILIAWSGNTYGLFASGSQIFYAERSQALEERFVVEDVFFDHTLEQCGTTNPQTCLLVYVRNVGVEEINVGAIYVNGTALTQTGWWTAKCDDDPTPLSVMPVTIPVGGYCEFMLNFGSISTLSTLTSGSIFSIVVASLRGNRATFTVRTPCYLNDQWCSG